MTEMKLVTDYQEMLEVISEPEIKGLIHIYEEPFIFLLNGKVVVVGELEMWNSGKCVYIKNINSIENRKGYGRLFIEFLLKQLGKKEIAGESVPEAVPFWFKMGAKFQQNAFDEYISAYDEELSGLLIPFTITSFPQMKPSA